MHTYPVMTEMSPLPEPVDSRLLDAWLVTCAQGGDRVAFGRLAARWNRRLLAHATRLMGHSTPAADVVQAAWVEIVRGLPRLTDPSAFPAWAYRIVTRRAARAIRDLQAGRRLDALLAAQGDVAGVETELPPDQALAAAIRALPPEQRAAIALHYFEELSVAEVAVALMVPAGTVKTRLMHARRKLRAVLEGETP